MQVAFQKLLRHARSFLDVAAANAKRAIDDRRIVKNECLFARGRAIRIEHFHFFFEQARRQFAGIRYCCRTTNKPRIAAVEVRNASQTPQHIAEMAPKDSAVGVKFIDHDVAKIFEEPRPACVMWQNAGMQHVRIREYHMAFFADGSAGVRGCVAVICENAKAVIEPLV